MGAYLEALKEDRVILISSIIVAILLIIIAFLTVKLIMEIRKEKKEAAAKLEDNEQTSTRFQSSRSKKTIGLSETNTSDENINSEVVKSSDKTKVTSQRKAVMKMRSALMEIEAKAKLEKESKAETEEIEENEALPSEGKAESIEQAPSSTEVDIPTNVSTGDETVKVEAIDEEGAVVEEKVKEIETVVEESNKAVEAVIENKEDSTKTSESVLEKEAELTQEVDKIEDKVEDVKEVETVAAEEEKLVEEEEIIEDKKVEDTKTVEVVEKNPIESTITAEDSEKSHDNGEMLLTTDTVEGIQVDKGEELKEVEETNEAKATTVDLLENDAVNEDTEAVDTVVNEVQLEESFNSDEEKEEKSKIEELQEKTIEKGKVKKQPSASFCYKLNGQNRRFKIDKDNISIGRDAKTCDFLLRFDSRVGRKHAVLTYKDHKYFILDLGSKNGTYINKIKLKGEQELKDGDEVKIADTELIFKIN